VKNLPFYKVDVKYLSLLTMTLFFKIQDIPKEVLSLALRYHPDQYVYSILTEVCEQLNTVARWYKSTLQTGKSVLLLKGTPQLITTYSKTNSLSSVFLEKISRAPIWNGYCRNSNRLTMYNDNMFIIQQIDFFYEETFYKYDISNHKWNHTISLPSKHMCDATCCFIKKDTMILTGGESLPPMGNPSNIVKLVNIMFGTFTKCKTRLPFNIGFPNLIQVEEKKVILLGGKIDFNAPSQRVLEGKLSQDGCDVTWNELNPVNIKTSTNIAFKLQNQLILTYPSEDKKTKSMVYHITKNKWMQGPETDLSIDFFYSNIFIDPKQNYALLMNSVYNDDNREMRMVMYEINKGFCPVDSNIVDISNSGPHEGFQNISSWKRHRTSNSKLSQRPSNKKNN